MGVMAFRVVQAVLVKHLFQSLPLSRMKLVILWKAWYITACWRGMVLGSGEAMWVKNVC